MRSDVSPERKGKQQTIKYTVNFKIESPYLNMDCENGEVLILTVEYML